MTRRGQMHRLGGSLGLLVLGAAATAGGCAEDPPVVVEEIPVAEAAEAPPVVSGGSMTLTRDGRFAVIADNSADAVYFVTLDDLALVDAVELEPGDEPGRVIEGTDGELFVALRRGGAVVRISASSRETVRADVCPSPRGMAWDADTRELHVACAGGALLTLNAELERVAERRLEADLRDVVVKDGRIFVSQFRSARILEVGAETVGAPPAYLSPMLARTFEAAVAYRMKMLPNGQMVMLHQRGLAEEIPTGSPNTGQTYYGGNCDEVIVHAAATVFDDTLRPVTPPDRGTIGTLVLPLDLDVSLDGQWVAAVGAGSDELAILRYDAMLNGDAFDNCFDAAAAPLPLLGEPVSVAFTSDNDIIVQTRQPASILRISLATRETVAQTNLPASGGRDWGHALFNKQAGEFSPIACASCHPEGREDGRTWQFANIGARRTQTVAGDVLNTMPLHWDGDMTTLHDLMGEVFVNRMGGVEQPADRVEALGAWMQTLKPLPAAAPADEAAVARGEQLFHNPEVGCVTCHGGASLTSNATVDVGTGKAFQVPTLLGVAHRAPFMHDGCASTLRERFDDPACGGGDAHGKTSQLSAGEIDDLIAYLETL